MGAGAKADADDAARARMTAADFMVVSDLDDERDGGESLSVRGSFDFGDELRQSSQHLRKIVRVSRLINSFIQMRLFDSNAKLGSILKRRYLSPPHTFPTRCGTTIALCAPSSKKKRHSIFQSYVWIWGYKNRYVSDLVVEVGSTRQNHSRPAREEIMLLLAYRC